MTTLREVELEAQIEVLVAECVAPTACEVREDVADYLVTVGSHIEAVLVNELVAVVVIHVVRTHDDTILLADHCTDFHLERSTGDTVVIYAVSQ